MFGNDKQHQKYDANRAIHGSSRSLSGRNTQTATTSSNARDENSPDLSTFDHISSNTATYASTTTLISPKRTYSPAKQHQQPPVSHSAIHPFALQSSYVRGSKAAATAVDQIENDMLEVTYIIANYAVEPLEMLHLVDRWLQQVLSEFQRQHDHFKYQLCEKWQNQELTNVKYDNNERIRQIYAAYRELEQARDTILSHESFDGLKKYLEKANDYTTNELKEKCDYLIQQYYKILQCLDFVDKETKTNGDGSYTSDIKKILSKLKQLNDKPSHTICIVGLEKAGKSTFINALLGYELLPTASERCTQIRTVLKPLFENGDQQLFATVKFYNDQEFQILFEKMTKKTDEHEQQLQRRKEAVLQTREIMKVKFPEEHFLIKNASNAEKERKNIIKELNDYITGELFVNIIQEVAIYTEKLPGRNYELLDVPGFDSPIKEHREAGLQAVKSADAFLFLTNGQQPSLTQPQIDLLHEIQQNHFEAMQRAFGIITKLDLCQTLETYKDHYGKAATELMNKCFKPERIYAACPRIQILQQNSDEYHAIQCNLHIFGNELLYGFERSKDGLNKFIEYELPKTHLKQLIDLGKMRLAQDVSERIDKIKELLPQNLKITSINEYIKQQNIESWDQVYDQEIFQPVFNQANYWHTTIVTKERAKFVDDVKQKFSETFFNHTEEFLQRKSQIEQLMFEKPGYSKIQLNVHPIDNEVREKLSIELEKIVDRTSDFLARHFYHKYIREMEIILNGICPQSKHLFRTELTLEKCTNETHALILRVCRPIIMAALRYSHLDLDVKQDAINQLIYIAPFVSSNIMETADRDGGGGCGKLGEDIRRQAASLVSTGDMAPLLIKSLFNK